MSYTPPAKPSSRRTGTTKKTGPQEKPLTLSVDYEVNLTISGGRTAGRPPRDAGWARVAKVAARKLDVLDYADVLSDLRSPPGNRLETLTGRLAGLHSIRINDQWRVVFRWTDAGPAEVDIRDYH